MRALFVALTLFLSLPAAAQTLPQPPPFLAAEATGEVRAAPDRAVVRFGVQHQHAEAKEAQKRVNQAMQKVMDALRARGIPKERISTERLELFPVYDHRERPNQEYQGPILVGFRAANVVRVELPIEQGKADKVGEAIDAAIGAGANTVEGIQFEIADPQPHYLRALRIAAENAREKTQALASALGVGMGRLLEVREGGGGYEPPRPYLAMDRAMKAEATSVSPGELIIRAAVQVRYEVAAGR